MTGPTKGLGTVGKEVGGMGMWRRPTMLWRESMSWMSQLVSFWWKLLFFHLIMLPGRGNRDPVATKNTYDGRVAQVENQIIARLWDRLGTAQNANEMFRVFSKFNALFVQPKVGIQEYQTQLINSGKEDVKRLHGKVGLIIR
jgi:hypothetical protein